MLHTKPEVCPNSGNKGTAALYRNNRETKHKGNNTGWSTGTLKIIKLQHSMHVRK